MADLNILLLVFLLISFVLLVKIIRLKSSLSLSNFIDISGYLDKKIDAMKIYESEIGDFPFPRSEKTMRSLAAFRGSQSGYEAAESFELVYERKL